MGLFVWAHDITSTPFPESARAGIEAVRSPRTASSASQGTAAAATASAAAGGSAMAQHVLAARRSSSSSSLAPTSAPPKRKPNQKVAMGGGGGELPFSTPHTSFPKAAIADMVQRSLIAQQKALEIARRDRARSRRLLKKDMRASMYGLVAVSFRLVGQEAKATEAQENAFEIIDLDSDDDDDEQDEDAAANGQGSDGDDDLDDEDQ